MACNSDYLEPNEHERELRRAAKLLVYVYKCLGEKCPPWVKKQAGQIYAANATVVPILCETLKALTQGKREAIIYNARNRTARNLADWWERHEKADRVRLRAEKRLVRHQKAVKSAFAKLTLAERKALQRYYSARA